MVKELIMSHFSVAVITKGNPTITELENILFPYHEYDLDMPYEYLQFHSYSKDEDVKKEYESADIPWKTKYKTYEEFLVEWYGARFDDVAQDYGYWYNPNAKWDWWEVGGRWNNKLLIADGQTLTRVNSARIKNLWLETEQKRYENERYWDVVVNESKPRTEREKEWLYNVKFSKSYLENHYKSQEEYADLESLFYTHAVVDKDGDWHEKGEMGWFGVSSEDEKQAMDWKRNYKERFLDNADEDDWITIIDCHI